MSILPVRPGRRRPALAPRPDRLRKRLRSARPEVEPLEGRALMAVTRLSLLAMQSQTLTGSIGSAAATERYRLPLKAGDILAFDVDSQAANSDLRLVIRDRAGRVVFSADDGNDPDTGAFTRDPSGDFRATADGTFTVVVSAVRGNAKGLNPPATPPTRRAPVDFTVGFRRFSLSEQSASTNPLQNAAGNTHTERWTWISGNTLFMTDAAGNGFGIKANWSQQVVTNPDGTMSSVYTTDGRMSIDMTIPPTLTAGPNGKPRVIPGEVRTITLDAPMTVTTDASFVGDQVGTIRTTTFGTQAPFPGSTTTADAAARGTTHAAVAATQAPRVATLDPTNLLSAYSQRYGLTVTSPGTGFGLGLGRDLGFLNAPLRPDGTYFYVQRNTGYSATFGGVTAGSGSGLFTLIIDPADPFVYARVADKISFGASVKGLIPYVAAASNYSGPNFSGHLYGRVSGIQVADLPVTLDGDITIGLDANRDGINYNFNRNASPLFRRGGLASNVVREIQLGLNGTVNYGTKISGLDITFPVGSASFGYTPSIRVNTLIETITRTIQVPFLGSLPLPGEVRKTPLPNPLPAGFQAPASTTSTSAGITTTRTYAVSSEVLPIALQVAGSSANPLAGTPVANLFTGNQFLFQAGSSGFNASELVSNFNASLSLRSGGGLNLGGIRLGGPSQELGITANRDQISVNGTLNLFVGQLRLNGAVRPNNGSFLLTGSFDRGNSLIPIPSFLNVANGSFSLARNFAGTPDGFRGNLNLGFNYSAAGFGIAGGVGGSLIIQPGSNISGNFNAFGEARTPDIDLGFLGTIPGIRLSLNVGVGFDGNGITIDMPSPIPDLRIPFR